MSKVKPSPLPPDTIIGGYRIIRKVAAGGFGLVYLALDSEGQQVAVKEYLPSSLATRGPGELLPQVQAALMNGTELTTIVQSRHS